MSVTAIDFSKRCFVLITGASKGIGRSIALEISRQLTENSVIVLLARSEEGLEETKTSISEIDKTIIVITKCIDLSKPDNRIFENLIDEVLSSIDTSHIDFGLIFHNAGSTGQIKPTTDLTNLSAWQQYYNLNLFSVAILNSICFRKIRPILLEKLAVINITSLCGRTPFMNLAQYGSGKAARELFFKVLALEEPNIIVLNYSPGPVATDMFDDIIENAENETVRNSFKKVKETSILTPEQTVQKLVGILGSGSFKSGDTIDYYDRE